MDGISCKCDRIDIFMVCMWFIGFLGLMHSYNLRFEVEMQYNLFLGIDC